MPRAMSCSATGFKSFLVFCNVVLLFIGMAIFFLGMKIKWALSILLLTNIPIVLKTVKAIIVTGFIISLTGVTGICGACYELLWLLLVHIVLLGFIVVMEFSLSVTLMFVKKAVEKSLESSECNNICIATVDAAILEYALPSAGLMVAIIFVEAMMIYSSARLYFYIRDAAKPSPEPMDEQNVQMETVSAPPPAYVEPPTYVDAAAAAAIAPQPVYVPAPLPSYEAASPLPIYAAAPPLPQPMYVPQVSIYNRNSRK